jgi:hypothetical protein
LQTYNPIVQKNVQTQSSKINDGKEWTYELVDLEIPHLHQCVLLLLWATSTRLTFTNPNVVLDYTPYARISKKKQNVWLHTKNNTHVGMPRFYNPKMVQSLEHKMNNLKLWQCKGDKKTSSSLKATRKGRKLGDGILFWTSNWTYRTITTCHWQISCLHRASCEAPLAIEAFFTTSLCFVQYYNS